MLHWISEHSSALQVILSGLMVVIWIAYLQVFLISFRRQHSPDILINLGAGSGLKTRCFVSNLGLEPIYLLDVIVEIETDDGTHRAIITDRTELSDEELNNPAEATNQGPLESGSYIDIGKFETLVQRAESSDYTAPAGVDVKCITIRVIAATAAKWSLIGAERKYRVQREGDRVHLNPVSIAAKQMQSRRDRRKLRRELEERLVE